MKLNAVGFHASAGPAISVLGPLLATFALIASLGASPQPSAVLVDWNRVWKYDQSGANLAPSNWNTLEYDDSHWVSGQGLFAFPLDERLPPGQTNRTMLLLDADGDGVRTRTYYFRTIFQWHTFQATSLTFSNLIDDGAVIYLNGQEVGRIAMPDGPVDGSTAATRSSDVSQTGYEVVTVNGYLEAGDNVLAVELHQPATVSGDVVFGCYLRTGGTEPPCVFVPPTDQTITLSQCQNTNLSVADFCSSLPPTYQWFKDSDLIEGATNATYRIERMDATQAGTYFCRVQNAFGSMDSRTFTVIYAPMHTPPRVIAAHGLAHPAKILVQFSEGMSDSVLDPSAYQVSQNSNFVWGVNAIFANAPTNTQVLLTLGEPRSPGPCLLEIVLSVFDDCGEGLAFNGVDDRAFVTPGLRIDKAGTGSVRISWMGSGMLEQADTPRGSWSQSPNQQNPQTIPASGTAQFYRVRN